MGKLYVITRKDLPLVYQGVQAGHGLAQWMLENPNHHWKNKTLVYLSVDNEYQLNKLANKLKIYDYSFSVFYEPDIGNKLTSVACYTKDSIFSKLNKMGD